MVSRSSYESNSYCSDFNENEVKKIMSRERFCIVLIKKLVSDYISIFRSCNLATVEIKVKEVMTQGRIAACL